MAIQTHKPLSYIEINAQNIAHNVRALRSVLPAQVGCVAAIKANAYGHGQNLVAEILAPHVDYFGVDDVEELALLRESKNAAVRKKPVLIFGYVQEADLPRLVKLSGTPAIYDLARAKKLNQIGARLQKKIPIHIKVDAFLGRQGIAPEDALGFCAELRKLKHLHAQGIYAHFANIEDTSDFTHAQKQITAYQHTVDIFRTNGFPNIQTHIAATSGVLAYEQHLAEPDSLVRIGIGLYGLWPSTALQREYKGAVTLKPALRWVSHVAQIRTLPKGRSIGYGLTYITTKKTTIAIVPQGYSDGLPRALSSKGFVLIGGKRCPILGRVMMNMCVVDVSHVKNPQPEDEVVLIGTQQKEMITAEDLAKIADTINYEFVARLSPLLPRMVV